MSSYDRVFVPCKSCGHRLEFQTKTGGCWFDDFELHEAPADMLGGIDGESEECDKCGVTTTVHVKCIPYLL